MVLMNNYTLDSRLYNDTIWSYGIIMRHLIVFILYNGSGLIPLALKVVVPVHQEALQVDSRNSTQEFQMAQTNSGVKWKGGTSLNSFIRALGLGFLFVI